MLRSEELVTVADPVVEIFASAEQDIIDDIARRIVKTGRITDTAAYQIEKAKAFNMLNGDVAKILARATGQSEREIAEIMKEAGIKACQQDSLALNAAGLKPVSIRANPALLSVILQGCDTTNAILSNFTKTTSKTAPGVLTNVLDRTYLQIQSGAISPTKAIQMAIRELANKGIYQIAYENRLTGRNTYTSVEAAVRRAVMTGTNQSCGKITLFNARDNGCKHVVVSSHVGARPSHALWQGKVYRLEGSDRTHDNFYEATGYGTGDGLCGWGCRHTFFMWFEGISPEPSGENATQAFYKENEEVYKLTQKQRQYERQVREAKKAVSAYNAAIEAAEGETREALLEDFSRASVKLKEREKALEKFVKDNNLTRQRNREFTGNWNRSVSAKAVWANRKARK